MTVFFPLFVHCRVPEWNMCQNVTYTYNIINKYKQNFKISYLRYFKVLFYNKSILNNFKSIRIYLI